MKRNNTYTITISPKQQEIIQLLFRFSLLTRMHIQKLLHHKGHRRILEWLSDLEKKKYINKLHIKENNGGIFYLEPKGISLVKKLMLLESNKRLSVKNISLLTIDRYLRIVDMYIQIRKDTPNAFNFFTQVNLPDGIDIIVPDAYITYITDKKEKTYFLQLDRETQSIPVMKKKIEKYSQYYYSKHWKKFTKNFFPAICIVSITKERTKKLIALLEELFEKTNFAPIVFKCTTLNELLSQGTNAEICSVPFEGKKRYTLL